MHVRESPWTMTVPLMILALLSIAGGWVGIPHLLGAPLGLPNLLEHYFDGFFAQVPAEAHPHEASTEVLLMAVSTGAALVAMFVSFRLFSRHLPAMTRLKSRAAALHTLLARKYFVDELYDWTVVKPIHWTSRVILWLGVDVRLIDWTVNAFGTAARSLGGALRLTQNGVIENYAVGMALGAIAILWWLVF
jgi:NADH-quinone oxidoreductase subunit L